MVDVLQAGRGFQSVYYKDMSMPTSHKNLIPFFIILAVSVSLMATDLYLPAMPMMVDYFLSSDNTVQNSISTYQLGLVASAIIYGPLSDTYGRRRILLIGYGLFFLSSALLILIQTADQLLWLRFIQGCGAGVSSAIGPAIVRESFSEKDSSKIIAQMSIVILLTPAIAPILGGYLTAYYGWQACFVFILLVVCISFLTFLKMFPETNSIENREKLHIATLAHNYKKILSHRGFVFYVLYHSLPACALWCYLTVMPFAFIKYMKVSEEIFGYFVFTQAIVASLTYVYVQKTVTQKGPSVLMSQGLKLFGVGTLIIMGGAYFAPGSPWITTACALPFMVAPPFIFPTAMAKAMSYAGKAKGAAASCIAVTRQFFAFVGSLAAAIMNDNTFLPAAMFMAFIAILMAVSHYMAKKYEGDTAAI